MQKTLKQIIKEKPEDADFYLFWSDLTYPQPNPETSENFITDYQDNAVNYNLYAVMKRGNQSLNIDEELKEMMNLDNDFLYMEALAGSITDTHLEAWARLYYALSLSYNPIYNVDGVTSRNYSAKKRTDKFGATSGGVTYGAVSASDIHGAKSSTLGEHTDTSTDFSVSFDSATEKETGKTSNVLGAQTNTEATYTDQHTETSRTDSHQEATHTDEHSDDAYTETETRQGNIGVTMTQQMLEAEWEFRKKEFFSHIINQMLDELGFMYIGGITA